MESSCLPSDVSWAHPLSVPSAWLTHPSQDKAPKDEVPRCGPERGVCRPSWAHPALVSPEDTQCSIWGWEVCRKHEVKFHLQGCED